MTRIFFEDQYIKVYLNLERKSLYTLITFADMTFSSENGDFFASKPAEHLSINVIGVVAKFRNWYPKESIFQVVEKLRRENSPIFKYVITYGGSMGGYAAIKYSASFHAKKVIAYVPQWTIEPNNPIQDNRFINYYLDNGCGGQAIINTDISGDVFVFYDPLHHLDSKNIAMIEKAYAQPLNKVKLFNSGHHATTVLAGTNIFEKILSLVCDSELIKLKELCFSINKKHDLRLRVVIEKALKQHPVIMGNILVKIKANIDAYPERFRSFIHGLMN